ncbi:hypothetical protein CAEBREN_22424 [Caenorhabditis brenneri]|uniref:Uncharacterized protein n=1 Tax=Caenorhabditis brenneri TaxID=135651 RepID=G0NKD7_CAEBE|nr:hypothetical protein CAEBREN_22424 [Caenorhabditis brenneri]
MERHKRANDESGGSPDAKVSKIERHKKTNDGSEDTTRLHSDNPTSEEARHVEEHNSPSQLAIPSESTHNSRQKPKLNSFGQRFPISNEKEEAWFLVLRDSIIKHSRDNFMSKGVEKSCKELKELFPIDLPIWKICQMGRESLCQNKFLGIDVFPVPDYADELEAESIFQYTEDNSNEERSVGYLRSFLKESVEEREEEIPVMTKLSPKTLLLFLKELSKEESCHPTSDDELAVAYDQWTKSSCDKKRFKKIISQLRPLIQHASGLTTFDKIRIMYILREKPSPEMIKGCELYGNVHVSAYGELVFRYISRGGYSFVDYHPSFIDPNNLYFGNKSNQSSSDATTFPILQQQVPIDPEAQGPNQVSAESEGQDHVAINGPNNEGLKYLYNMLMPGRKFVCVDFDNVEMEVVINLEPEEQKEVGFEDYHNFEPEKQLDLELEQQLDIELEQHPNSKPEVKDNATSTKQNNIVVVQDNNGFGQSFGGPELDTAELEQKDAGFDQENLELERDNNLRKQGNTAQKSQNKTVLKETQDTAPSTVTENSSALPVVQEQLPTIHNGTISARFLLEKFSETLKKWESPLLTEISQQVEDKHNTAGEQDRVVLETIKEGMCGRLPELFGHAMKSTNWNQSDSMDVQEAAFYFRSFIKAINSPILEQPLKYVTKLRDKKNFPEKRIPKEAVDEVFNELLKIFSTFVRNTDN